MRPSRSCFWLVDQQPFRSTCPVQVADALAGTHGGAGGRQGAATGKPADQATGPPPLHDLTSGHS